MTAESGKAHITLATGTETDSRRADDIGSVEQLFEELPRGGPVRSAHPDIGGIFATIALESQTAQDGQHVGGILHIVVNGLLHLLLALGRVDGLGSALGDVAGAVELGTLSAQP